MYSIYYVVNKEMSAQIYEQQYADMKQIYMRLCEMDVDPWAEITDRLCRVLIGCGVIINNNWRLCTSW